jgi:hypothetical protein
MSKTVQKQGRLDHLAKGVLNKLLKEIGNPEMRFTCKLLEEEIDETLEENLGPGTQVHKVGQRILRAINRGDR